MARKYRARMLPLVAIVVGLERAFWRNPDIGRLVIAQPGEFDPELFQMEACHLLIEMFRQHINFVLVFAGFGIGEEFDLRQRLVGKGGGHDKAGMAGGVAEIDKAALRQKNDPVALWEMHQVNLWLDVGPFEIFQFGDLDFIIEMADVADDGHVLHLLHVINGDDILVAGRGHKNIGIGNNIRKRLHRIAIHRRLQARKWDQLQSRPRAPLHP